MKFSPLSVFVGSALSLVVGCAHPATSSSTVSVPAAKVVAPSPPVIDTTAVDPIDTDAGSRVEMTKHFIRNDVVVGDNVYNVTIKDHLVGGKLSRSVVLNCPTDQNRSFSVFAKQVGVGWSRVMYTGPTESGPTRTGANVVNLENGEMEYSPCVNDKELPPITAAEVQFAISEANTVLPLVYDDSKYLWICSYKLPGGEWHRVIPSKEKEKE